MLLGPMSLGKEEDYMLFGSLASKILKNARFRKEIIEMHVQKYSHELYLV
jgi:hypothetical protein